MHEGLSYACHLCDHVSSFKSNLKRHVSAIHGDDDHHPVLFDDDWPLQVDIAQQVLVDADQEPIKENDPSEKPSLPTHALPSSDQRPQDTGSLAALDGIDRAATLADTDPAAAVDKDTFYVKDELHSEHRSFWYFKCFWNQWKEYP